jgi:hypothetical protein
MSDYLIIHKKFCPRAYAQYRTRIIGNVLGVGIGAVLYSRLIGYIIDDDRIGGSGYTIRRPVAGICPVGTQRTRPSHGLGSSGYLATSG